MKAWRFRSFIPTFNLIGALNLASNSLGSVFNTTSLNEIGVWA